MYTVCLFKQDLWAAFGVFSTLVWVFEYTYILCTYIYIYINNFDNHHHIFYRLRGPLQTTDTRETKISQEHQKDVVFFLTFVPRDSGSKNIRRSSFFGFVVKVADPKVHPDMLRMLTCRQENRQVRREQADSSCPGMREWRIPTKHVRKEATHLLWTGSRDPRAGGHQGY